MRTYATPATEPRWPAVCAGGSCGACCDRITTRPGIQARMVCWVLDPRSDGGWWALRAADASWKEADRAPLVACWNGDPPESWRAWWTIAVERRAEALFVLQHWRPHPDGPLPPPQGWTEDDIHMATWTCSAFDPVRRLCTAGAARPPICSRFPHYGRRAVVVDVLRPTVEGYRRDDAACCSYAWALAPADRVGLRPLLPLADVTGPHGR